MSSSSFSSVFSSGSKLVLILSSIMLLATSCCCARTTAKNMKNKFSDPSPAVTPPNGYVGNCTLKRNADGSVPMTSKMDYMKSCDNVPNTCAPQPIRDITHPSITSYQDYRPYPTGGATDHGQCTCQKAVQPSNDCSADWIKGNRCQLTSNHCIEQWHPSPSWKWNKGCTCVCSPN